MTNNNQENHLIQWTTPDGPVQDPVCSCGEVLPTTDAQGLHPPGTDPYGDHIRKALGLT